MGQLALSDFRDELATVTGQRGFNNPRLDRWINFAYADIAGAVDIEELEDDTDVPTVAATASIAKPAAARVLLAAVDETSGELLQNIDKTEYFRLDRSLTGAPLKWAQLGSTIYLHPTPDAVYTIKLLHKIDPTLLVADGDTTILSDTWDPAIHMLSVHYAYMGVGEDQRAALWMNRAVSYIQSRSTAEEIFMREPGLGLSMAVPKERLISAMEEALRGSVGAQ